MITHQRPLSLGHPHPNTPESHASTDGQAGSNQGQHRAPLGTPSYSHKHPTRQSLTIAVGGEYARVRFHKPESPGERHWVRGNVQAFSARSRSRLLQSFAQTDFRGFEGRSLFVTLTYHHEWGEVGCEWKADLKEWERRIRRKYPHVLTWWRLELQRRGAPHFHCLVFGLDESAKAFLKQSWLDVAEACCKWCHLYMARVDKLASWEQVRNYCSKYCAKVEELTPEHPGRYWGILNRSQRTVRLQSVEVSEQEAFRMRRIFKRLIRAANGYHKPGGSRSGVWVRCSNETAKRALDCSSAHDAPIRDRASVSLGHACAGGMPASYNDWNSRDGWAAGLSNSTVRSCDRTTDALSCSRDWAARRARRLFA